MAGPRSRALRQSGRPSPPPILTSHPTPATQVEPHNGLSSAPLSGYTDVSAAEDGHEAALDDQGSSALPETTRSEGASSDASAPDAGPFQWLRSALAGGNASARKDGPASGDDQPASNESDGAVGQDESDEECFVTRLVVHPAFTPDERRQLQERVSGFSGVQRATVGAVQNDSFEMHVTHELYTSMLGSLLASAGENIRLIAQRDDSLEIEITALDWALGGAGAT
jgi:hypothetical protein